MTSPVMSAPAVSASVDPDPIPVPALPVARAADPDEYGPPLTVALDAPRDGAGPTVLRVAGEIDLLTVAPLRAALDQALAAGRTVVADLRDVSFVDCAGIGLLVDTRVRARARGIALQVLPSRSVTRVAALLELTSTLGLAPTPNQGDRK